MPTESWVVVEAHCTLYEVSTDQWGAPGKVITATHHKMHPQVSAGEMKSFPRVSHTSPKGECRAVISITICFLDGDKGGGQELTGEGAYGGAGQSQCRSVYVVTSRVASSVPGSETRWARCGKSQVWRQRTLAFCRHQVGT